MGFRFSSNFHCSFDSDCSWMFLGFLGDPKVLYILTGCRSPATGLTFWGLVGNPS